MEAAQDLPIEEVKLAGQMDSFYFGGYDPCLGTIRRFSPGRWSYHAACLYDSLQSIRFLEQRCSKTLNRRVLKGNLKSRRVFFYWLKDKAGKTVSVEGTGLIASQSLLQVSPDSDASAV